MWEQKILDLEARKGHAAQMVGYNLQYEIDKIRQEQTRNRKVNLFMRDLYEATLKDQISPGVLDDFFEELESIGAAGFDNNIWEINPTYLEDDPNR